MSIHGVLELAALLPPDLAAALQSGYASALPPPDACADAVAAALAGAPHLEALLASLTAQHGSACAKDAAGACGQPACAALRRCIIAPVHNFALVPLTQTRRASVSLARFTAAEAARAAASEAFKRGAFADAADGYSAALRLQPVADDVSCLAPLFTARACALQRLGHAAAAERDCDRAIELDQARLRALRACCVRVPAQRIALDR
jgi:tetratricopeptide (TPR) repeat protein